MKLVYICSPFAGDVENNVRFAKAACRYAMKQDCAPVAVHLMYPQILNDAVPSERKAGIRMGLRVLVSCEELWVCGGTVSHGMSCEIAKAGRLGIPVRYLSAEQLQSEAPAKQYGILARRSAASVCGAAESWVKRDGMPAVFGTYEEAAAEVERLNGQMGSVNRTVEYFPKEMEAVPEEAPSLGMELHL
jgi:hypothetical protein